MAVTITNNSAVFNEGKNLLIILNDANASLTHKHEEEDFVLLFDNQKLIGINVFDFQKYFKVESGFHLVNSEVKKFFSNWPNNSNWWSFWKCKIKSFNS